MNTFALLIHPKNTQQARSFWPVTRIMPDFLVKSWLKNIPAFKIYKIKSGHSSQGQDIKGYLIACPLLSGQMLELGEDAVMDKIIAAGHIAEKLGANILGLDGYNSIAADKDYIIAKRLRIPVTRGSTLTAWSVFEAIYRVARTKNINLKKSVLAVVGATNPIGSLCARKLSEYVSKIILFDSQRDKLGQLKETILQISPLEVVIEEDARKAVKDADIVIITSAIEPSFDTNELKMQAVVCDVSGAGSGVNFIRGGLIKLPYPLNLGVKTGLPKNVVYASIAEAMLLATAARFVSYSLGDNINLDKLEEIANIAAQHGFEVWAPEAPLG
jgi:predicted amino acid dehydrogenase